MAPQNTPDQPLRDALALIGRRVQWRYSTNVVARVLGVSTSSIRKRTHLPPGHPDRIPAARMGVHRYVIHPDLLRLLLGQDIQD